MQLTQRYREHLCERCLVGRCCVIPRQFRDDGLTGLMQSLVVRGICSSSQW